MSIIFPFKNSIKKLHAPEKLYTYDFVQLSAYISATTNELVSILFPRQRIHCENPIQG